MSDPTPRSTPENAPQVDEQALLAAQRRRNVILLVVLLAIVGAGLLASYPLFNKYHDPYLSGTVISH